LILYYIILVKGRERGKRKRKGKGKGSYKSNIKNLIIFIIGLDKESLRRSNRSIHRL
jgi:hypothetical protein